MSELPQTSAACTAASYPFDLDTADVVLRTSDRVEFRVHRAILGIASPVFATMFQLPQAEASPAAIGSSLPVVDVSEDSNTLDTLLRMCYPVPKKENEAARRIASALEAAMKYDMEWPASVFTKVLEDSASQNPLDIWSVACRLGVESLARKAATCLLDVGKTKKPTLQAIHKVLGDAELSVLEGVSAGNYYRLDEFLRRQGQVEASFHLLSPAPVANMEVTPCAQQEESPARFITSIPHPDVICRSSDGADRDFGAHRAILALRSVSFKPSDRPQAPSSGPNTVEAPTDPRPVLHFEGDAQTLSAVLDICYNNTPPSLSQLAKVVSACDEYETVGALRPTVLQLWTDQARIRPLHAFLTAVLHRLSSQARGAAQLLLSQASLEGFHQYAPLMEEVPAEAYHKLVTYGLSCARAVQKQTGKACTEFYSSEAYGEDIMQWRSKGGPGTYRHTEEQDWLPDYLGEIDRKFLVENSEASWFSVVGPVALLEKGAAHSAAFCSRSRSIVQSVLKIGSTLPRNIAAAIDEVRLDI